MKSFNSWEELITESERNMEQLELDKTSCFQIYATIRNHFNLCLESKDYFRLLELLPYFEDKSAYSQLHHSGETMRIYIYLHILKSEQSAQKEPFVSNVNNYDEFLQQYTLTLFSIRRLEMMLSNESKEEAVNYLHSIPFNIFVARFIVENECFENFTNIYWNVYECMKDIWSTHELIQWLVYLFQKAPSTKLSLELGLLYLKINRPDKAFDYLQQIPSPTPEIQSLISSLKELLPHE